METQRTPSRLIEENIGRLEEEEEAGSPVWQPRARLSDILFIRLMYGSLVYCVYGSYVAL